MNLFVIITIMNGCAHVGYTPEEVDDVAPLVEENANWVFDVIEPLPRKAAHGQHLEAGKADPWTPWKRHLGGHNHYDRARR